MSAAQPLAGLGLATVLARKGQGRWRWPPSWQALYGDGRAGDGPRRGVMSGSIALVGIGARRLAGRERGGSR